MIDWTINFGHVLTLVGFIITVIGLYYALKQNVAVLSATMTVKLEHLGGRMINVENDLKSMHQVLTEVAVQNVRCDNIESQIGFLQKATEEHRVWASQKIASLEREVAQAQRIRGVDE